MLQVNPEMTRSATGLYKQNNVNVVSFHNLLLLEHYLYVEHNRTIQMKSSWYITVHSSQNILLLFGNV